LADWIPDAHRQVLAACRPYHETATHLFVHAGFLPELPLGEQPGQALRWRVTDAATAAPHCSGKVAVVGHTAQRTGAVLDLGFLVCIDTNCARGGWLACDVRGGARPPPRWVACRPRFFLPVRVLSRVFRSKYLALLRQAQAAGQLRWHGALADLAEPAGFAAWLRARYRQDWVVYAKPPFGGAAQVVK
jgi:hypothetical protein